MKRICVFILASAMGLMAYAQPQTLKPTAVTVFSNGVFFVKQDGSVTIKENKASLAFPQQPLKGSFWLYGTKDTRVSQIDFVDEIFKTTKQAQHTYQMVVSNIGKTATIIIKDPIGKELITITGKLKQVVGVYDAASVVVEAVSGNFEIVKIAEIARISFAKEPNMNFDADSNAKVARVHFGKNDGKTNLQMLSLQTGFTWYPGYLLKLEGKDKAKLLMQATLKNDAFDLKDVALNLAIGNPALAYGMELDPIVSQYVAPRPQQQPRAYSANGRAVMARPMMKMEESSAQMQYEDPNDVYVPEYQTAAGEDAKDLYIYTTGKVTIAKSERSIVPVAQTNITFDEVYIADLQDHTGIMNNRIINNPLQNVSPDNYIVFTNKSDFPFADAPVMMLDENDNVLGRANMAFTPKGGETRMRIGDGKSIAIKNNEEEVERKERVKTTKNQSWDRVYAKGEIKLKNNYNKEVKIKLTKTLNGEVTASDNAKVKKQVQNYYNQNPLSVMSWEIVLAPGATKTLDYKYEVYIVTNY
jgi:hypothetical protein